MATTGDQIKRCMSVDAHRVFGSPLKQQQLRDLRVPYLGSKMERSDAVVMPVLGIDRRSILQQIVHDIFMAGLNSCMQCGPDLCTCPYQLLCEASLALTCRTCRSSMEL